MEHLNQCCISAVTEVKDLRASSTLWRDGISKRIGPRVNHRGRTGNCCVLLQRFYWCTLSEGRECVVSLVSPQASTGV